MAVALLARNEWTSYAVGTRPAFEAGPSQGPPAAVVGPALGGTRDRAHR